MVRPTALIRGLAPNQTHLSLVDVSILVEKSIKVVKTWLASKTAKAARHKKKKKKVATKKESNSALYYIQENNKS